MEIFPKVSIIIPVLNEPAAINRVIEHTIHACGNYDHEIIVVDGSETKDTLEAVSTPDVVKLSSPKGRALQMNAGANHSKGEALLFLHADTYIYSSSLPEIFSAFKDPDVVGGAFDIRFDESSAFFSFLALTANLRSRTTRIPYGDQAQFFRKNYFIKIGGFKDIPVMEDVEIMQRVKKDGKKIHISAEKITTSARRWRKNGLIRTTLNNHITRILYSFGVSADNLLKYRL